MSMNKIEQNRLSAPGYRQLISFIILQILVLQNLLFVAPVHIMGASPSLGANTVAMVDIPTVDPFIQNFDSIGTTASATLPTDFRADRPTAVRTVGSYATAGTVTTAAGGANLSTTASNGIYNFGSGTNATGADRAIGFLSSGSATQSGNLYAKFTNNTGGNLDGIEISYDVEKYRNGTNSAGFRIQLFYSTDGTNWNSADNNFLTSFAADANNSGFATVPGTTTSISNKTLSLSILESSTFYLAWNYSVASGATTTNAQALAIDNISIKGITSITPTPTITPTVTPTPTPILTPTPTPTATPTPTPVPVATHVVISQIYGGGGNSGASYTNDFVELYNPTDSAVNLAGWTLQYASAAGSGWDSGKQPLGGIIGAGEYYLISLASGTAGQALPAANISGELNLSGTTGKIALVGNGDSLSGDCPLDDADVVDFVGFGTSANCSEGNVKAPAPSNSNAIFRQANGMQDTNVNGTDFFAQIASPRRTAPIVEIGPSVLSTDPRNNFTNSPRDSSLTITFTEPIFVDPQWFSVSCAVTGVHNDATVASNNNGKNYVITPNVNFRAGEQCSVTISKNAIHDQDSDDSAPNTDTLAANYSFSFSVSTGTPPPYSPDVHLTMGNPTDAVPNVNEPNNYLMEKPEYALSYNRDRGTPNWVSWHLDDSWIGSLARVDTFRPDPAVPSDWYRVQATDYFNSGFDRGHMVPNADRDPSTSNPINQATFLMSNMVPQAPDNNQGPWAAMENDLRNGFLPANELYIIAGGAGTGGTGDRGGVTTTIADGKITVPAYTWKVALIIPKAAGDDISRVTAATRTIAVIMPNSNAIKNNNWRDFLVSIDQVEALTGYDFYENLPDAIENSIEAGIDGNNPPGTTGKIVDVVEDNAVSIALEAAGTGSLTYEIVGQPTNGTLTGTGANRIYTPNLNFNGTDSFTFHVNDGRRNSNTSTVTINVSAVNDNPVANNDSIVVAEDSGATTIDVLGNDSALPEIGETLTVTSITQGTNGSVVITNGGTKISYTPAANFFGADSFSYTISDGNGGAATATVSVQISAINDSPNITAGASISRQQNGGGSVSPIANVSDIDNAGSSLVVTVLNVPTGIVVSNIANNNGAITAVVSANCAAALGNNTVVLQVSDDNLMATANLTVNVTPSNPPVITLKPFINLSAPNHKYQTISLNQMVQSVSDDCSGNLEGNVVIERVTSDEAENGVDDGDTPDDIVIGADCKTVLLRAERSGTGNGRVYTITLRVSDSSGNVTRANYKAFVQLGNQTPIDDGAVYTVNSNCL